MGRAGSGGHSGGHSSGGHSSGRSSGGHHVSSGGSHRAGSSFSGGSGFNRGGFNSSYGHHNDFYYGGPHGCGRGHIPPPPAFYGDMGYRPPPRRHSSFVHVLSVCFIIIILCFSTLPGLFSISSTSSSNGIPASSYNREKVNTGVAYNNNCIVDELGWFDNISSTERKLQNFYNETGVQPYIVLRDYDSTLTTDDEKQAYAEQYYDDNIDNEGTFLFMYFAEQDTDNDVGYMCYVNGKQVTSVMDSEAVEIFWAILDNKWYSDMSTDDMFVSIFNDTADRIMTKSTISADVGKRVVTVIGVIAVGVVVIILIRMKFKRDKEKAAETERILNTPLDNMYSADSDPTLNKYMDDD
jgi:hypothetical protein